MSYVIENNFVWGVSAFSRRRSLELAVDREMKAIYSSR